MLGVEFYARSGLVPVRLGIFPGSFNPPTLAHRELIHAAAQHVDEVLCVFPRVFPHKEYFGATLEERLDMLAHSGLAASHSIAVSDQGLFVEIARECREHYGGSTKLNFICGADAAERILGWDYGRPEVVDEMLREFELLVAPRSGRRFEPPAQHRDRVHRLHVPDEFHDVSSTQVRARIKARAPWEHLVPEHIVDKVHEIYTDNRRSKNER